MIVSSWVSLFPLVMDSYVVKRSVLWGDGPPLPAVTNPRGPHFQGAVLLKYNMGDAVLLEYIILGYAVLLEYIRSMLGVAIPGSGDPKPAMELAGFI